MSATWTCPYCNRSVLGSNCYCMASEEQKLHGRIEELEAQLAEALDRIQDYQAAAARWEVTLRGGKGQ
jgi:gamma-glutamylcyclotransferase (GGCT)/AIG2-like uncharacterized protein YtfP